MPMITVTDKKYQLDHHLKNNLDILKREVRKNDFDNILVMDGMEGSGKSCMGASICYYLAYNDKTKQSSFTLDNIVWSAEQLEKVILKAPKNTAILCDEFVLIGLSTQAMTSLFTMILQYFTTIRKKNLHIIIIMPYIYMVATYFAVARTRALIHVMTKNGFERGYFKFYNYAQKRYLYFEGKKHYWGYPKKCDCSFHGRHNMKTLETIGIDVEEYNKRKDEAINKILKKKGKKDKYKNLFFKAVGRIREQYDIQWKDLPKVLDMKVSWQSIQRGFSRYKEEEIDDELRDAEKQRQEFKMPEMKKKPSSV